MSETEQAGLQSAKAFRNRYERNAMFIGILLIVACFLASVVIQLSGAVTTEGLIVRQGDNIMLQHTSGGLVEKIHVKNGDTVQEGDLLLTLDGSDTHSEYNRLTRLKLELSLQIERAKAALAGKTTLGERSIADIDGDFSKSTLLSGYLSDVYKAPLISTAVNGKSLDVSKFVLRGGIFAITGELYPTYEIASKKENSATAISDYDLIKQTQEETLQAEQKLIAAQIHQAELQVESSLGAEKELARQISTTRSRLALVDREIAELSGLVTDKLLPRSRITSLEREKLETRQRLEALQLEQKGHASGATSGQAEIDRIKSEYVSSLWRLIETNEQRLGEVIYQLDSVTARRDRLEIHAHSNGRVHEMAVSNTGAVIRPGDTVLQIVPEHGELQVRVRIEPVNIDDVAIDQLARLRFDTFKEFASEELQGKVVQIAPDRSTDEATGQPFYSATIALNSESIDLVRKISPDIGAPITVMIETKKQSLARYLLAPAITAIEKTFSEG